MNHRIASSLCVAACLSLGACAALAPLAIETTRNLIRSIADRNYDPQYGSSMDKMFNIIVNAPDSPERTPGLVSASKSAKAGGLASGFAAGVEVVPEEERVPIELDVALLREIVVDGRSVPVPVANGEILRDGRGRASEGDNLKLRFRANTPCFVYAVWVDSTAWATPLFPRSTTFELTNPVQAGKEYTLPAGSQWFYLDDYRGVETLYFVASHDPIPELAATLGELVGRERPARSEGSAAGEELATLDQTPEVTRGLGGVRESTVQDILTSDGVAHEAEGSTFIADFAGSELVVTRWFRHQ
jgi:hypothetical protein